MPHSILVGMSNRRRKPDEDGPLLFKRGRWWGADLRPWGGNRPTLRKAGERTEFKHVAEKWAAEAIQELRQQTLAGQLGLPHRKTLEQAAEEYLGHCTLTKEYNTVKGIRTATNHLLAAFGRQRMLATISDDEVQTWLLGMSKRLKASTIVSMKAHVACFFEASGRPLKRKMKVRKQAEEDVDALSDAEIDALLAAAETDVESRLVRLGLATGGRRAELWALEWEDFKPNMRSVRFSRQLAWPQPGTKGLKGKRSRTAMVLPGFINAERTTGRILPAVSVHQADEVFRDVFRRAGCYTTGRGIHSLRHTYGRLGMERHKWSLEMLRVFLGHTNMRQTQRYAHFGQDMAIRLAEQLTYQQA